MNIFSGFLRKFKKPEHYEIHYDFKHVFHHTYVTPGSGFLWFYYNNTVDGFKNPRKDKWYAAVKMRIGKFYIGTIVVKCDTEEMMRSWINTMKNASAIAKHRIDASFLYPGKQISTRYIFNTDDGKSISYDIIDKSDYYIREYLKK